MYLSQNNSPDCFVRQSADTPNNPRQISKVLYQISYFNRTFLKCPCKYSKNKFLKRTSSKIQNKDNVIKVAYYISQYGYSKLCNTTIRRAAFDQIASLLNVKTNTFNLLVAKCMSLTSDKYPALRQASIEPSIKSIVESYSKIPEDKIFKEIQLILNLK